MKLIDKLLLAALVIFLPIGLFLSQWLLSPPEETTDAASTSIDLTKLEQVIRQTVAQSQPKPEEKKPFSITTVSYASESGILRVEGAAPYSFSSILVSVTIFPEEEEPNDEIDSVASIQSTTSPQPQNTGLPVEVFSIQPGEQNRFQYEYLVRQADREAVIELRFDQDLSTKSIRFDLKQKKQVI